ncbi:hypothetical protein HDU67_008121 [Dinochytrium kinnereticum]|nr:hypothetical protein HDU67_008121 [Dinochytrium kinnereticum]
MRKWFDRSNRRHHPVSKPSDDSTEKPNLRRFTIDLGSLSSKDKDHHRSSSGDISRGPSKKPSILTSRYWRHTRGQATSEQQIEALDNNAPSSAGLPGFSSRKPSWVGSEDSASSFPWARIPLNEFGMPILEILSRDVEGFDTYSDVGSPGGSRSGSIFMGDMGGSERGGGEVRERWVDEDGEEVGGKFMSRFGAAVGDDVCEEMEMEEEEKDLACFQYPTSNEVERVHQLDTNRKVIQSTSHDLLVETEKPKGFPYYFFFSSSTPKDIKPPDETLPPVPSIPADPFRTTTPPSFEEIDPPDAYVDPNQKKKRKLHAGFVLPTFDGDVRFAEERVAGNGVDVMPRTRRVAEKLVRGIQRMLFSSAGRGVAGEGGAGGGGVGGVGGMSGEVKKVVILALHGWFPQKWLQSVITGPPHGTSPRFLHNATRAVKRYFKDRYGRDLLDSDITSIPLEKEGMIEERAKAHFQQIVGTSKSLEEGEEMESGWVRALRDADLIMVVSHSQGVPVSVLLMDLLCQAGILEPSRQRVCVLAMAGIWHGPFPALQAVVRYVDTPAGNELFDLTSTDSRLSVTLLEALARCLCKGLRVVAVSSWFDEVVPFYSSSAHALDHPHFLRAIFIDEAFSPAAWGVGSVPSKPAAGEVGDGAPVKTLSAAGGDAAGGLVEFKDRSGVGEEGEGRSTPPLPASGGGKNGQKPTMMASSPPALAADADDVDFLTHLIVFSLKLRNRGMSDHGLSLHISKLIAGTFLGTRGHSALYDESETYMLAISFAMGSKDIPPASARPLRVRPFSSPARSNPYGLTFSMARIVSSPGILADPELKAEVADLLDRYDRWMPSVPELRAAKFALDGLKVASLREHLAGGGLSGVQLRRASQG